MPVNPYESPQEARQQREPITSRDWWRRVSLVFIFAIGILFISPLESVAGNTAEFRRT